MNSFTADRLLYLSQYQFSLRLCYWISLHWTHRQGFWMFELWKIANLRLSWLSKAFDTRSIILSDYKELNDYGFSNTPLNWFASVCKTVCNLSIVTELNQTLSLWFPMHYRALFEIHYVYPYLWMKSKKQSKTLRSYYMQMTCICSVYYVHSVCSSSLRDINIDQLSKKYEWRTWYSYTLSRGYRVARNRYSRLLFASEDRICANLRLQEQSTNMTSKCQCLAFGWRHRSTVMTSQC